jgi:hypothetical protein
VRIDGNLSDAFRKHQKSYVLGARVDRGLAKVPRNQD